jgi:hypothetical protein
MDYVRLIFYATLLVFAMPRLLLISLPLPVTISV